MMTIKLLAAATAAFLASAAQATVTIYSDPAAFAAALATTTTEDFTDTALAPGLSFVSTAGNIGNGRFNDRPVFGVAETRFAFVGGANGFGASFDQNPGGIGQGLEFTLNLVGGGTEVAGRLRTSTVGFFGFTSTKAFDSVSLRGYDTVNGVAETYNLDNLQFGSAVPEPGSWALLIIGFGLVGAGLRSRRGTMVIA